MKKLLVILMVVAVASFLFVGCFDVTDPEIVIVDDEDEELVLPPTVAPIITSVPDIVGGYINKANAADGIVVNGTAPTYSEVKVYINGLTAGTGDTLANGAFQVVVANADLIKAVKTDGEKVLCATATEDGKAESDSSNKIKFILDTKLPTIDECSAKAGIPAVKGTAVATPFSFPTSTCVFPIIGFNFIPADVVSGVWTVEVVTKIGNWFEVIITDPNGVPTTYTGQLGGHVFLWNAPIPGVKFKLKDFPAVFPLDVGQKSEIVCTAAAPAVPGYIDVTFDEPVTGASILAGTWTAFGATVDLEPDVDVRSATEARLTEDAATLPDLVAGVAYSVSCSGPTDLAGNSILDTAPETCTGVVMP